ncbi:MAG: hypothetical protein WC352_04195 [Candidatus Omnitrophota bacterium]|jgi:YbbR domain-containing protein
MKWFAQNWGIKLFSLLLAVGLWYYAVGEEVVGITRTVPLEIRIDNAQLSMLKTSVKNLQVTLTAPRALFSQLVSDKIVAVHAVGREISAAGDYSFRVEPGEIRVPNPQIRVVKIEPAAVHVTLDEIITKKIKIVPVFRGDPAFGYKIMQEEIQLDPNAVLIEGPRGILEKQESIETEKIDLVGRVRPFRRTAALNLPALVKSMNETPIDIYVPIREESEEKNFENIPVKILRGPEAASAVTIEPAAVSFMLRGSKKALAELTADKILLYADASGISDGSQEVPVRMVVPETVSLKEGQSLGVKVTVRKT